MRSFLYGTLPTLPPTREGKTYNLICFVLYRHRMVQYPQICFSALSVAEVNISSGENKTAPNCSTWVRPSSASKCQTDRYKSVSFVANIVVFNKVVSFLKTQTYTFFIKIRDIQFFLQILMLRVCKLEEYYAWGALKFHRVLECRLAYNNHTLVNQFRAVNQGNKFSQSKLCYLFNV